MVWDPVQRHNLHAHVRRHGVFQDKHRGKKQTNWRRDKKRKVKGGLGGLGDLSIALMDDNLSRDNCLTCIVLGERGFNG